MIYKYAAWFAVKRELIAFGRTLPLSKTDKKLGDVTLASSWHSDAVIVAETTLAPVQNTCRKSFQSFLRKWRDGNQICELHLYIGMKSISKCGKVL